MMEIHASGTYVKAIFSRPAQPRIILRCNYTLSIEDQPDIAQTHGSSLKAGSIVK